MAKTIRIISQLYDTKTGRVELEKTLNTESLKSPKTIKTLGYNHKTQIRILQEAQNFKLSQQEKLINMYDTCPKCGKKNRKQGKFTSPFHAIFTDHELEIQRKSCTCGWQSLYTIEGLFGCSLHPELLERQSLLGANHSFRNGEAILDHESCKHRSINNDDRIKRTIALVGETFEAIKKDPAWSKNTKGEKELIVTVDGGHLKSKIKGKRSFEAMIATIYSPKSIRTVGKKHRKIISKTSVASAKKDKQHTMKQLVVNASKKQGMTRETKITALTDGACNCWNIIEALSEHSKNVVRILDWFHIGKLFKMTKHLIPEDQLELYDKVKWHLWHGHPDTSLIRLNQLKEVLEDEQALTELEGIGNYIINNRKYITNYHARRLQGEVYTSSVAETSVNSLINTRQKQNQKMQWSRSGAHAILQLRTSLFSKNWKEDWGQAMQGIYKEAA